MRPPNGDSRIGERRQLTVLFCDIVDSTALSERCDPEDLQEILRAFQLMCKRCVESLGGRITNYIGDGVRAQFGYPVTSEHEAENAARAGLAILDGMARLAAVTAKLGEAVRIRIGIHTGLAVIGRAAYADDAIEIFGETPNLAFRLQEIAEPNSIVISAETKRLLRGPFLVRSLGSRPLKGLSRPVEAFRLLGPVRDDILARTAHDRTLVPFVNRTAELRQLMSAWDRVEAGTGQVVELTGEPGIGKSRLAVEFIRRTGLPEAAIFVLRASEDHRNTPFYAVRRALESKIGLRRDESRERNAERLRCFLVERGCGSDGHAFLLGRLLNLPMPRPQELIGLEAQALRRITRDLLLRLLTSRDGDRPAVLLVDDMQWADPSSGDLVDHIARSIDAHRILLVIARRAEPVRAGAASNGFPRIALQRLDQQECERLAELVVQGRQISTELRHRILAQSDGVPLFIEELATAAVETGRLSSPQGSSAAELEPDVPFSLYDPLMIRLDRLGDAKRVAQLAAVIGRNFSHRILTAVAERRGEAAAPALARLVEADIVRLDRDGPERVYSFKHSLVRDVAYSSLLRRDRRDLHALVAETIETEFPDVAEAEPAYLAQHLAEAGLIAEAARMWLKAAKQAAEKSANSEAIAQLQAALNQIRRLPPGREQSDLELDVQLALIGPTIAAKGYGAPDLAAVSRRALDLCAALKDEVRIYPALYARWSYDRVTGDVLNACRLADEFLTLADRHGTRTGRMVGHRLLGTSLMLTGRFRSAREHLERCVALYDADLDQSAAVTYGVDARITALSLLSTVAWHLGDSAAGASYAQRVLDLAREVGHVHSVGFAIGHLCMFYTLERNVPMVEALAERGLQQATEREIPFWIAIGRSFLGWCEIESGRVEAGIATLNAQRDCLDAAHLVSWTPTYLCWLADAYCRIDRPQEAGACLAEARSIIEQGGESWFEPECWRLEGKLARHRQPGDPIAARNYFERALSLARSRDDRGFGLRAAMGLAELLAQSGQPGEARVLLDETLRPFSNQPVSGDRAEARAFLRSLERAEGLSRVGPFG